MVGVGAGIDKEIFIVDRQPHRQRVRMAMRRYTLEPEWTKIHQEAYPFVVTAHASQPCVGKQIAWRNCELRDVVEICQQVRNKGSRRRRGHLAETQPLRL